MFDLRSSRHASDAAAGLVVVVLLLAVVSRGGLLAVSAAAFALGAGNLSLPATLAFTSWYGQASLTWLLALYGLAAYGAFTSMGGRLKLELID